MIEYLQKKYAISQKGAKALTKSIFISFLAFCADMLPIFLMMFLLEGILETGLKSAETYVIAAAAILVFLYLILNIEYDNLYSVTYKESATLRRDLAKSLKKLPLSYFSKHDLADLSQSIMDDVAGIEHAISHSLPKVYAFLIFFPLIFFAMLLSNWKLALAAILPLALSFFFLYFSRKIQIKDHKHFYEILRNNSDAFQEAIELQPEIQSFNLVPEIRNDLYRKMYDAEKVHVKGNNKTLVILGIASFLNTTSIGIVTLTGSILLMKGEINLLYLLGFFLGSIKLKEMVDGIEEFFCELLYLNPKTARINEIKQHPIRKGKNTALENFHIEFKNVHFSYNPDTPVLKGVSFTAKQGEVTAICGLSGSGKSSILRLVSCLYDYNEGQIIIDGTELKDIATDSLFDKVSMVFQDVTLFNDSVLENIRIGRKDASDEAVYKAAEMAGCLEFIEKLPQGINTLIGENGSELSGGQRQRISIARAFLKDAPILLLDEIAGGLDIFNEKKIQDSLKHLIKNKTVLVISHRLKAIENVDKIVVLHDGLVEAEGTHEFLLANSPVYKNLIEKTNAAENFAY